MWRQTEHQQSRIRVFDGGSLEAVNSFAFSGTRISVLGAHHAWLELFPARGKHESRLPAKRRWTGWDMSGLWPRTTAEMTDSYLFEADVSLSNGVHLTVRYATGGSEGGFPGRRGAFRSTMRSWPSCSIAAG